MEPPARSTISAASAQLADAIKRVVPKIYEIMHACGEKMAGAMQPAVDQIVALCLEADLAYRKTFWVGAAVFTRRTVEGRV